MCNYNKIIQLKKSFELPYIATEGFQCTTKGIIAPNGDIITTASYQLTVWKSGFYDRGRKVSEERLVNEFCRK